MEAVASFSIFQDFLNIEVDKADNYQALFLIQPGSKVTADE